MEQSSESIYVLVCSFTYVTQPVAYIARLGHNGTRALYQPEAVPHQCRYACKLLALIVLLSITNQTLNGLEIERRSVTMYNPQNYESRMLTIHEFAV